MRERQRPSGRLVHRPTGRHVGSDDELLAERSVLSDERRSAAEQIGGEPGKEPRQISHGGFSYLDR
jgi:hypothetical protein